MNYKTHYNKLIETRRNLNRSKLKIGQYESHHILPRSMGGTDESFNQVLLTPKEHWIAHLLLSKFTTGQNHYKMNQALVNMGRVISEEKRKTSKLYSNARKVIAKEVSKRHTGTMIVKDLKTDIMIGRVPKDHPKVLSGEWIFFHTGKTRSNEFKNKVSKTVSGEKNGTFTGMTNDDIMNRSVELYEKCGYWTINLLRFYCEYVYNEQVPKSYSGKYRKGLMDIIKNKLVELGATKQQFGSYAKHHTNRIIEDIKNGN